MASPKQQLAKQQLSKQQLSKQQLAKQQLGEQHYRVEQLAGLVKTSVDTIRFYQSRKLLHMPLRSGRTALYDGSHLRRLEEIQQLTKRGFTLEQIKELESFDPLLSVLANRSDSNRTYTHAQLCRISGVSRSLLDVAEQAQLIQPLPGRGKCFGKDSLEMLHAVAALLQAGVDEAAFLELAKSHAKATTRTVDKAISLFQSADATKDTSRSEIAEQTARLLPHVVKLVANHFRQTLLFKSMERMNK